MKNEFNDVVTTWKETEATIYPGDICHPWKSVYGFTKTAGQLAVGQALTLHCREDEAFGYLTKLNTLLRQPQNLKRAYWLLSKHNIAIRQKLVFLITAEQRSFTPSQNHRLQETLTQLLTENSAVTGADWLRELLTPAKPGREIAGLCRMLARNRVWISALEQVKNCGFKVVIRDRRRQPIRPALEVRRKESILVDGIPTGLISGFLLPPNYHLALWAYLVLRSDGGQSAVWN